MLTNLMSAADVQKEHRKKERTEGDGQERRKESQTMASNPESAGWGGGGGGGRGPWRWLLLILLYLTEMREENPNISSSSSCPLSASLFQSRGFKAAAAEPRPETREHRSAAAERPDVLGGEERFRTGGVRWSAPVSDRRWLYKNSETFTLRRRKKDQPVGHTSPSWPHNPTWPLGASTAVKAAEHHVDPTRWTRAQLFSTHFWLTVTVTAPPASVGSPAPSLPPHFNSSSLHHSPPHKRKRNQMLKHEWSVFCLFT